MSRRLRFKFAPKQQVSALVSHSFAADVPSFGSGWLAVVVAIWRLVTTAETDNAIRSHSSGSVRKQRLDGVECNILLNSRVLITAYQFSLFRGNCRSINKNFQ